MKNQKLHFIGGGRITNIILKAFKNKTVDFEKITVFDTNEATLQKLKEMYPSIEVSLDIKFNLDEADVIFIALHPPVIMETLESIKGNLRQDATIVSLAPKITIQKIADKLGLDKVARLIPNATSFINEGYNPITFSEQFNQAEKEEMLGILENLGHTFETAEHKLEAYAIASAMLPTYFWFQWYKMIEIGESMGLSYAESCETIEQSLKAAINTMFKSGSSKEEVIDLIPVKPIGENEAEINEILSGKLTGLFNKIKP